MSEEVQATETQPAPAGDWKDSLSEDMKNNPSLSDIKDVDALAKGYVNAQGMIGRSVRIPGEDASDEARSDFYSSLEKVPGVYHVDEEDKGKLYERLGRPQSAEGYEYDLGEKSEVLDKAALGQYNQKFHEIGLSNSQAQELVSMEIARSEQMTEQLQASRESGEAKLKEVWGPDYDARLHGAKEVARHYSERFPDAVKELTEGSLGNNPVVLAILAEQHKTMVETKAINPQTSVSYGTSTQEAQEKIAEMRTNPAHPYNNRFDPGHNAAQKKMQDLYKIVYPN